MTTNELRKILIIEDDEDILLLIKHCFKKTPEIIVKCLKSSEGAMEEALIFHPDLILLDVMLPTVSGIDLFNDFQKCASLSSIPVVFFTAKAQPEEIDSYKKLGVLRVIMKPFDPLSIVDTIKSIWNSYSSRPN